MKTKYLIIAATLLATPLLAGLTQPAAATIVLSDSQGDYTVTPQTTTQGNQPTPSNDLANPFSLTSNALSKTSFFTLSPAGSCGSGCVNGTASDVVDVVINIKDSTGGTGTLSTSGTFTADYLSYSNGYLACSATNSGGVSDCFDWTGAATTPTGSVTDDVVLSDGIEEAVTLYNASDWDITPDMSIVDKGPVGTPEPASLALLGTALVGFGAIRRRRRAAA